MNPKLRHRLDLICTLARHEFSLMEQGTVLGFCLSLINNILMLLLFHVLFVPNFLQNLPNPWLYLLVGIIHWNLFINVSLGGFACLAYRQRLLLGFRLNRFDLIIARVAAIFLPYLIELSLVILFAIFTSHQLNSNIFWLPFFLASEFLFCVGIASFFAYLGAIHRNVLPFWNVLFRLLSFATPIFYLPLQFTPAVHWLYHSNPFTIFMLWSRHILSAGGPIIVPPLAAIILGVGFAVAGKLFFHRYGDRIGDYL